VYKRQFYNIVESNRIELFFPESECSTGCSLLVCCNDRISNERKLLYLRQNVNLCVFIHSMFGFASHIL